jgi:putative thiazole-containing bacteriocin maturation protein
MVAQNTRPKFKADTYCIPVSDGVYLRGNNSRLMLKGKSLYPLLKHLVPHLNGAVTLAEITEGLDADRKRMVTNLIEKLFVNHFLQDAGQDQFQALRPDELDTYAPDITFIDSFQAGAVPRFEGFREKQLLLAGSGAGFAALVRASTQCGVKRISGLITPEKELAANPRQDGLHEFASTLSEQAAELKEAPCWEDEVEVRDMIRAYDAILHISERPVLARARLLNRLCLEERKPFIQAIIVNDQVWLGPLVHPEVEGCWECAWRRLQANLEHLSSYGFHDQPLDSSSRSLGMPAAMLIANRLLFELFRYFTRSGPSQTARELSVMDLATLLSESHVFLPHPHCLACQRSVAPTEQEFFGQIQQLQQQSPVDPDALFGQIGEYVDEKSGLFRTIDEDDFVQAPLAVCKITTSLPLLGERQREPIDAVAVGTDTTGAHLRALQKACERYAANLVDRRRLLSGEAVQQGAFPVLSCGQLVDVRPSGEEAKAWTWALDLRTQQSCLVPAMRAFPSLRDQEQGAACERGVASGMIWEEAICLALLDWCNYLTVERVRNARQRYPLVDLARTPMTPEGVHLYELLRTADVPISVYDITGPLRVPTFATCAGKQVVAYSTHCDVAQALRIGLEQAVQQCQSEQFQQRAYALAPVPDLPASLRGDHYSIPPSTSPGAWSARQEWLLQQLRDGGFRAFAVPLNHDAALARMFPFIVRVLLAGPEEERGA